MYVYQNLWEDYIKDSEKLDLKSLVPKETLNPDLWEDEDTLKKEILDKLLKVANDFFENLERLTNYHDGPIATITYYIHSFLAENISKNNKLDRTQNFTIFRIFWLNF